MAMWMVRSGSGGRWADECRERGIVGLGWDAVDPNLYATKAELLSAFSAVHPELTEGQAASGASQLWRFKSELEPGDEVVTYDSSARLYHFGKLTSAARYSADEIDDLSFHREVEWHDHAIKRDDLSDDARNRLGSVLTLFKVPEATANELRSLATGQPAQIETRDALLEDVVDPFAGVLAEAEQRIADQIAKLNWKEMQELVGALLRAMGYKTEISPDGADRGKDIVASPDGFGFEQPRIVVEVKHRPGQKMDAPALRSFVGGRHKDDRGLYVSTGGFTKDAKYEADRSNIPLKLMTLEDLARAVIDNYETFDSAGRAMLPLKRLYWPA